MPLIKLDETKTGAFMLIYGETNAGKTASVLSTCELPAIYIQAENRGLMRNITLVNSVRKQNKLPELTNDNLTIYQYDTFDDTMDFCSQPANIKGVKTIIVDSLSFIMNVHLMGEIEDEAHDARTGKNNNVPKQLASQYKQTQEGYGILASAMKRFTNVLGIPAAQGATVVCIALEDEKAKVINGSVQRVPLFAGKDYLSNMPGFFDMIGRVVTRVDKDNKVIYPPGIMFESPDNSFMAKWTGPGAKRNFPLDIRQILEANK